MAVIKSVQKPQTKSQHKSQHKSPLKSPLNTQLGLIILAAAALPGVLPRAAHAEVAPENASISFKTLDYQDSQPGLERIHVNAPSIAVVVPLGEKWSVEAGYVIDTVSGASPRRSSAISQASKLTEKRTAYDAKISYYGGRSVFGVSASNSTENDYISKSTAIDARIASADNNTTVNFGVGKTQDTINPTGQLVVDQHRDSTEFVLGVTQALNPRDLLQVNLTHSEGKGYYNDPYKLYDKRPDSRSQDALLLRWNHHLSSGSTLRNSFRWYSDSYGIRAATYDTQWFIPISEQWKITPGLRYYSQKSASFYLDPISATDTNSAPVAGLAYQSFDQRLSSFGAVTLSVRVDYKINKHWNTDFKYSRYEQRSSWNASAKGSPYIDPFSARTVMFGVTYTF